MKTYAIQLSERQRLIAKVLCWYLVICTLFPPFYRSFPGGGTLGLGFHFVLTPPEHGRADTAQLLFQWIPAVLVSAIAMLLNGPMRVMSSSAAQQIKDAKLAIDELSQRIFKTSFDIDTERTRINELDERIVQVEQAARLWQGLISQNAIANQNQKELL